jgi:hypothetical protein
MNLSEYAANPGLLSKKLRDERATFQKNVRVNSGVRSSTDIAAILNNTATEAVDWTPLYQHAEQFDWWADIPFCRLSFRIGWLSRYRIVHVIDNAVQGMPESMRKRVNKLQEVAAFRFICEDILKIHPPRTHPELLYLLSRRHLNQEMLGLALDVFSEHCKRLKTRTPLDRPPLMASISTPDH